MLNRAIIVGLAILFTTACGAVAQPKRDYLVAGEETHTSSDAFARRHWSAVREICERAFRRDVVLRLVDLPPFAPEYAGGLARDSHGFSAFITAASSNLSYALSHGAHPNGSKIADWHKLKRGIHERRISAPLATRIAAAWRRVLSDQRNYGKDPNVYIDTDWMIFYLRFLPNEKITAHMHAWGPHVWQLGEILGALSAYADGSITEQEVAQIVARAERKLGI